MPFGSRLLPYKERPHTVFACPLDASPRPWAPPPEASPAAPDVPPAGDWGRPGMATNGHIRAEPPHDWRNQSITHKCEWSAGTTNAVGTYVVAECVSPHSNGMDVDIFFDQTRRVVHAELTRRSRTYLGTSFHCCYPLMTTILTRGAVGAALCHDQLHDLLLSSAVLLRAPGPPGS